MLETLNILYEDNHIIVVFKSVNVLSQADITNDADMLSLIKKYLKNKYNKEGNVFLGLVHRLDRMTSGIMVFAKTSKAAKRLCEQINNGCFEKKYLAYVEGKCPKSGILENYLYKDEKKVKSFVTTKENGKIAKLEFRTLKYINNNSLVDIRLFTGRHHQIRVQFSHYGHPLVGDSLYGSKIKMNYLLCAYYLSFLHPISKEKIEFINYPNWKEEGILYE